MHLMMRSGGSTPQSSQTKRNSSSYSQKYQHTYCKSSSATTPNTPIKLKNRYSSKSQNTPTIHVYHIANNTSKQQSTHPNDLMEEDMDELEHNDWEEGYNDNNSDTNDSNEEELRYGYKLYDMDIKSDLDEYDPTLEQLENYEQNKTESMEERIAYCKYLKRREIWILLILFAVIFVACYFLICVVEIA
eukprot:807796_1